MFILRKASGIFIALLLLLPFYGCNREEAAPAGLKGKIRKHKFLHIIRADGTVTKLANGSGNYFYDGNLGLKEYKAFFNDDPARMDAEERYIYQNNRVAERQFYRSLGPAEPMLLRTEHQYYYGAGGQLDSLIAIGVSYGQHNVPIRKWSAKWYLYYTGDRLTSWRRQFNDPYSPHAGAVYHHEYQYDGKGNLTGETRKTLDRNGALQSQFRYAYAYDDKVNPFRGSPNFFPEDLSRYLSPNNPVRTTLYTADGSKVWDEQFSYEYDAEGKPVQESRTLLHQDAYPVRNPETTVLSLEYY